MKEFEEMIDNWGHYQRKRGRYIKIPWGPTNKTKSLDLTLTAVQNYSTFHVQVDGRVSISKISSIMKGKNTFFLGHIEGKETSLKVIISDNII